MPEIGHPEVHMVGRIGWLRAAVLGANDGIISTASLIVGVAAASVSREGVLIAGVAGMTAGAMAMAAGEYVSVSAQSDTEKAETERERRELQESPEAELQELTNIYTERGLAPDLAHQVAVQLTAHDALGAHLRDELNITEAMAARPFQAAWASGLSFAAGAVLPLLAIFPAPPGGEIIAVSGTALVALAALGALGARAGGASALRGAVRIAFWGALAMAATAVVGEFFGAVL